VPVHQSSTHSQPGNLQVTPSPATFELPHMQDGPTLTLHVPREVLISRSQAQMQAKKDEGKVLGSWCLGKKSQSTKRSSSTGVTACTTDLQKATRTHTSHAPTCLRKPTRNTHPSQPSPTADSHTTKQPNNNQTPQKPKSPHPPVSTNYSRLVSHRQRTLSPDWCQLDRHRPPPTAVADDCAYV
jgi:hypothetical protein